jgi:1-acyl-sn-glycerol-3-phosphate acyltransferase
MLLGLVNIIYIIHTSFCSALFILSLPLLIPFCWLISSGKIDDAFRILNWMYGRYMVRISWPLLKIKIAGKDNISGKGPFIITFNHFSMFDPFFTAMVPIPNQLAILRDWVFRIKLIQLFCEMANYINIDVTPFSKMDKTLDELFMRGVSVQFYPEAHRSENGKLKRFRNGAFLLACRKNRPILPVCLINTEKFVRYEFPFFHPVKILMKILPPVYPYQYTKEEYGFIRMRKHVFHLYQEQLNNKER